MISVSFVNPYMAENGWTFEPGPGVIADKLPEIDAINAFTYDAINNGVYKAELYQYPGVADTVNFDHIKHQYYRSHDTINPNGIVPSGPILDLERAPSRQFA